MTDNVNEHVLVGVVMLDALSIWCNYCFKRKGEYFTLPLVVLVLQKEN